MVGLEDQRHPPAFHFRVTLDLADRPQFGLDLDEDVATEVDVGHLTSAELQGELHLVPLFEELAGMVNLDHQIVVADLDGLELQLLELPTAVGRARLVFLLLLLVAPLPVVHDFTDGRAGHRGDLDEIEAGLAGSALGFVGRGGTNLLVVLINQEDGGDPDLLVVAEIRRNGDILLTNNAPLGDSSRIRRRVLHIISAEAEQNDAKYTLVLQEKIR